MSVFPFFVQSFEKFVTRAGFVQYVKNAYYLGGYDIVARGTLDLDEQGLEFFRTLTLRNIKCQYEMRIIDPEDLIDMNGGHPKVEQIIAMYGVPVSYEHQGYKAFLRRKHG